MIEIFILIAVFRSLANRAQEKGRSRAFGWLGVGGWVLGEIIGVVIAVAIRWGGFKVYALALPVALLGLGIAYVIVANLAPSPDLVKAETFD